MYRQQKFEEAKTIFVELESSIQDPVSAVFAGRCDEFMVRHSPTFLGFCGWLLTDVCLCTGGPAGAELGRGLPAQVEVNMNGRAGAADMRCRANIIPTNLSPASELSRAAVPFLSSLLSPSSLSIFRVRSEA